MLEQLLNEIRKGGTLQPAMLAARLDLSTAMVEAMLADLERKGCCSRSTPPAASPAAAARW